MKLLELMVDPSEKMNRFIGLIQTFLMSRERWQRKIKRKKIEQRNNKSEEN